MKEYILYTDGACSGNPGRGGCAAIAYEGDKPVMEYSQGYPRTTNNRMELMAAIGGLWCLFEQVVPFEIRQKMFTTRESAQVDVTIFSDSALLVNTMNGKWKRKSNQDLWESLDKVMTIFHSVTFKKVKGHADNPFNQAADRLAVEAAACKRGNEISDKVYEQEHPIDTTELFVVEIRLLNVNKPEDRKAEAILSDGTTVTISARYEGFEQCGCTKAEAAVTVDLAFRLNDWLHGEAL